MSMATRKMSPKTSVAAAAAAGIIQSGAFIGSPLGGVRSAR